jgi:hypothetical protein
MLQVQASLVPISSSVTLMLWMTSFQRICSGSALPSQSVRELVESGFVVVPGPVSGDPFNELTAAYVMAAAAGPDFKIASTTTRMSDLLTLVKSNFRKDSRMVGKASLSGLLEGCP